MAMGAPSSSSSSLRPLNQTLFPKNPFLSHHSRFRPTLRFPSTIRATSAAVALEPDASTQLNHSLDVESLACPVCYEPLIRKGPPGFNLPAIYRSGFKCRQCNKSYSSKDMYLDLTVTAGTTDYSEVKPARTELFRLRFGWDKTRIGAAQPNFSHLTFEDEHRHLCELIDQSLLKKNMIFYANGRRRMIAVEDEQSAFEDERLL